VNFGFFALFGMALWPLAATIGPKIEGSIFPVAAGTQITVYEAVDEAWTDVYGYSRKIRECEFHHIEWSYEKDKKRVFADVVIKEPTKARGGGEFSFGAWSVKLTPDQIRQDSRATTYHRCHPFWLTETTFFP